MVDVVSHQALLHLLESDEPELILEAHLQHAFSLTNSLDLVRGEIDTTQELINQRLDAVRNRLLLANMIVSICSLCVAFGSFVGSIFGMVGENYKAYKGRLTACSIFLNTHLFQYLNTRM